MPERNSGEWEREGVSGSVRLREGSVMKGMNVTQGLCEIVCERASA